MTKREVIKTLLAKEIPDRVGLDEHFWPFIIDNAWAAQGVAPGTDFVTRFDLDIRNVSFFWVPGPRKDLEMIVKETDEWVVKRNDWGASFKFWKAKGGTPEHVDFSIPDPDVWKKDFREQLVGMNLRDHINLEEIRTNYKKAMAEDRFVTFSGMFVFEELRRILGDVTMLESLLLEPEWIHDFNTLITDKNLEYFQMLFDEVGLPDGLHIYEDLGYTAAPFASPACHRELILPYHKKLFGFFKDHNLPVIMHTCGDFRPHIESIIEAGVDCIQAMEGKTGMNVVTLAEQYKDKLCFMGNLDIRAMESGNRDRIKEECLGKLNGMKKLRAPYIYMSDHSIPPTVKLADYEYMLELYRDNCRY